MSAITQTEFDRIIDELIYQKPVRYDALCAAADKLLKAKLKSKCASVPALARSCTYEDLLSEIYIRLIKCAIPNYFLRTDTLNDDLDGFCRWVYTVGGNICIDKIKSSSSRYMMTLDADQDDEDNFYLQIADPEAEKPFETDESVETLRRAFELVLDMDVQVYKVITWVAQAVIILSEGVTKIESNDILIEKFENFTLYEMWDEIVKLSATVPWLRISENSDTRLRKILEMQFNESVRYGEMHYSDFYMKKGAKASVSDWVNRINSGLRRDKFER